MAGDFVAKIEELQEKVGRGSLAMRVNVHQPYAAAEHNKEYRHPRGGGSRYIEEPLEAKNGEMLNEIAEAFPEVKEGAMRAVEKFTEWMNEYAPVMTDTLRESANLYVEDNGGTIYEQPQTAPYEEWKEGHGKRAADHVRNAAMAARRSQQSP